MSNHYRSPASFPWGSAIAASQIEKRLWLTASESTKRFAPTSGRKTARATMRRLSLAMAPH